MVANKWIDPEDENQKAYEDLLVAIESNQGKLSILIAVCDHSNLRDQLIQRYEAELQPDIRSYRVTLARGEPSLRAALAELVQGDEYLHQEGQAVLTVTGTEQFYCLKQGADRSEQEIFFGYLQWTREGLREFPYPIVIWVTNQILANLSKKAPDFWSWRRGIFRFISQRTTAIPSAEIIPFYIALDDSGDNPYFLPLEDLEELIHQIEEKRGKKDPSLATLYERMGQIYKRRLECGEAQNYQVEQALAIEYFYKAIDLQKQLGLKRELACSLNNLANLYEFQGYYTEAEPLYVQALELRKGVFEEEHPDVAISLNNLAGLYTSQGRYSEAEPLYVQALELSTRLWGEEHPDVAACLNNLARLYTSQGRYNEAEPLYMKALELTTHLWGEEHPDVAASLNNLADLYTSRGRYNEAEPLYVQALELSKRLLGKEHPHVATSLNNLAHLYKSQGRYSEAEPLYVEDLELSKRLLGEAHPNFAASLNNLAGLYTSQERYSEAEPLYVQALELSKRLLGQEHPHVASSLNNLAHLYKSQGRYSEAEPLYLQALDICERRLGGEHPHTVTVRKNLEHLHAVM